MASILYYSVDIPAAPATPAALAKPALSAEPATSAASPGCAPCASVAQGDSKKGGRPAARPRGGVDARGGAAVKALSGLTTTTSECAEDIVHAPGTPCATKKILRAVAEFAAAASPGGAGPPPAAPPAGLLPTAATPDAEAVRAAAAVLGCSSESCVIAHPSLRGFAVERRLVPARELELELELRYKAPGPRDSLALLSNFNLDETLRRWARVFPEFYPCPFAMMDFDHNGDYFAEADLPAILEGRAEANLGPGIGRVRRRFTCFGCVVNTDTSRGPGKHWVAVFVDCRPPPGEHWTVEYFNSAGRPPPKPMLGWMERTRARLAEYRAGRPDSRNAVCDVVSVPVTDMDHQESQTECGLYALFYLRRRLEGTPFKFFEEQLVPDDAMTAFRRHVFASYR